MTRYRLLKSGPYGQAGRTIELPRQAVSEGSRQLGLPPWHWICPEDFGPHFSEKPAVKLREIQLPTFADGQPDPVEIAGMIAAAREEEDTAKEDRQRIAAELDLVDAEVAAILADSDLCGITEAMANQVQVLRKRGYELLRQLGVAGGAELNAWIVRERLEKIALGVAAPDDAKIPELRVLATKVHQYDGLVDQLLSTPAEWRGRWLYQFGDEAHACGLRFIECLAELGITNTKLTAAANVHRLLAEAKCWIEAEALPTFEEAPKARR